MVKLCSRVHQIFDWVLKIILLAPLKLASPNEVIRVPEEMSLEEAIRQAAGSIILLAPGRYEISKRRFGGKVDIRGDGNGPGDCVITLLGNWEVDGDGHLRLENLTLEFSRAPQLLGLLKVKRIRELMVLGRLTAAKVVFQGGRVVVADKGRATFTGCSFDESPDSALQVGDSARVALENCTVYESSDGISVSGSAQVTLAGCTISETGTGISVSGSAQVTLEGCTISETGTGISVSGSTQVILKNCTVSESSDGISVSGSAQVTLEGCTVSKNQCGLLVSDSAQVELVGDRFWDNHGFGLVVKSVKARVTGRDNEFWGNWIDLGGNAPAGLRPPLIPETNLTKLSVPGDYPTLQEALDAIPVGGTIILAPGTYKIGLTIWKPVTIRGAGRGETILTAPEGHELIVSIIAGVAGVVLEDLSVQGNEGDGLWIWGQAQLRRVDICKNKGKGLEVQGSAQVTLEDCTVSENYRGISVSGSAQVTLEGCTISETGTGISVSGSTQVILKNCTVSENRGDGISVSGSAQVTLEGCTVSENDYGYGLSITDSTRVTLTDCTVSENRGDGLSVSGSAQVTLKGCTVSENRGNGLSVSDSAQVELVGDRFWDNHGFGLVVKSVKARVTGRDNEFWGNWIDLGGNAPAGLWTPLIPETNLTKLSVPGDYPTLQEALDAIPVGGTIILAPGTYKIGLTIWKPVTIRGAGRGETILTAPEGHELIVSIIAGVAGVVLEDLSVQGNEGDGLWIWGQAQLRRVDICKNKGKGLEVQGSAQVTLEDCTVSENYRGISVRDSAWALLTNCTVSENRGNGLCVEDSAWALLADCTVSENRGNGLCVEDSAWALLADCTVSENVYGLSASGLAQVTFTGCTVSENKDNGLEVGGSARIALAGCTVRGNGRHGLFVKGSARIAVRNSRFSGNRGWGVAAADQFDGQVIQEKNEFSGNGKGDARLPGLPPPWDAYE